MLSPDFPRLVIAGALFWAGQGRSETPGGGANKKKRVAEVNNYRR